VTPEASSIEVHVWSDVACPWCYIGKRNLEEGISEFAGTATSLPVEVTYHSFELAPDTPVEYEGSEIEFLMNHRGISAVQARAMIDRVVGIALAAGLRYDYDALQHTNTIKAHQLLHYAKARGRQLEMKERLLSAYFTEGRHVGRVEDLADLAGELSFDREDVLRSLSTDEYLDAVRADMDRARAYGIRGVPFFVVDDRYGISGAHPPEVFTEVLTRAGADRSEQSA
jgi:predicted DsbA family dithiol-disulfide isomerase